MATQHAQGSRLGSSHYQSFRIEVYRDIVRSYLSEGHASLGLIVVGEAGQGKSSLINGLLGKQLAKEGYDLDPETQEITKYEFVQNGVAVVLWDTPGFGMESDEREEEALRAMASELAGKDPIDLMLYCIRMDEARWPKNTDITTIRKITEFFGPNIWQCCQFVLTFANQVMGLRCPPGQEPEQFFSSKVVSFENKVRETLIKHAQLTEEAVEQVRVVPVGDPHQSHDRSWELPSIEDWFVNFWLECSCRIRQSALPTLINLNKHRTTDPAQDESSLNPPDPSTQLYEHSLPSSALDLDSLETPQLALTVPPDQCPASAESSPMPSLVQSSENSSVALAADHKLPGRHDFRTRNDIELSLPADCSKLDDSPGDKTPEAVDCKESLKDRKISTYRTLYCDLKNKKSGFREYVKIYWEKRGKEIPGFGHVGGLLEALFQWLECSVIVSSKSIEDCDRCDN